MTNQNLSLEQRFRYDAEKNRFYVNFESFMVEEQNDINRIEFLVAEHLSHLDKRVDAIVNYENFCIKQELLSDYANMVNRLMEHFYAGVTRYTTSSSLRDELERSLQPHMKPNIFCTNEEAEEALKA